MTMTLFHFSAKMKYIAIQPNGDGFLCPQLIFQSVVGLLQNSPLFGFYHLLTTDLC